MRSGAAEGSIVRSGFSAGMIGAKVVRAMRSWASLADLGVGTPFSTDAEDFGGRARSDSRSCASVTGSTGPSFAHSRSPRRSCSASVWFAEVRAQRRRPGSLSARMIREASRERAPVRAVFSGQAVIRRVRRIVRGPLGRLLSCAPAIPNVARCPAGAGWGNWVHAPTRTIHSLEGAGSIEARTGCSVAPSRTTGNARAHALSRSIARRVPPQALVLRALERIGSRRQPRRARAPSAHAGSKHAGSHSAPPRGDSCVEIRPPFVQPNESSHEFRRGSARSARGARSAQPSNHGPEE